MKRLIIGLLALLIATPCLAGDVYVKGHYRKDGTYVAPYHRSSPNQTVDDNYSTRGNVNPYTGKQGTEPGSGEYGVVSKSDSRSRTQYGPYTVFK